MPVTDEDEKRVAALILRDVAATGVLGQEEVVRLTASTIGSSTTLRALR